MAKPTIEDLKDYSGVDYADEVVERRLTRALNAGIRLVEGGIGSDVFDVLPDERVPELALIYADDLYNGRGTLNSDSAKVSGATRRLVNDLEQQLKLEYRVAKEGAV